ncbi:MAG: multinuclear nonheme iron-dependent oxidase, partial [Acidimicrobiia bacterium]
MSFPALGTGLGWRPGLAGFVAGRVESGDIGFVEVLAEHVDPRRLPEPLISLRDKGVPIVVHGLSLSLGGAERPRRRRLRHLAACAEALQAPLVSEHLAFVRAGRLDSGHLLPVPRTSDALEVVCANIAEAQAHLP